MNDLLSIILSFLYKSSAEFLLPAHLFFIKTILFYSESFLHILMVYCTEFHKILAIFRKKTIKILFEWTTTQCNAIWVSNSRHLGPPDFQRHIRKKPTTSLYHHFWQWMIHIAGSMIQMLFVQVSASMWRKWYPRALLVGMQIGAGSVENNMECL